MIQVSDIKGHGIQFAVEQDIPSLEGICLLHLVITIAAVHGKKLFNFELAAKLAWDVVRDIRDGASPCRPEEFITHAMLLTEMTYSDELHMGKLSAAVAFGDEMQNVTTLVPAAAAFLLRITNQ